MYQDIFVRTNEQLITIMNETILQLKDEIQERTLRDQEHYEDRIGQLLTENVQLKTKIQQLEGKLQELAKQRLDDQGGPYLYTPQKFYNPSINYKSIVLEYQVKKPIQYELTSTKDPKTPDHLPLFYTEGTAKDDLHTFTTPKYATKRNSENHFYFWVTQIYNII